MGTHREHREAGKYAARETEERDLKLRMERIGRKLLVLSGKGGVGKSTIAANVAVALAKAGKRVGLLDVDLHGPSIPKIIGIEGHRPETDANGAMAPVAVMPNLRAMSLGLLIEGASDAVIWRGPLKYGAIKQLLKDVAWGDLDFLIVDSPPGTGDEPLAVAQLIGPGTHALVVTTPQDVAITDVRRSISFCRKVGLKIEGIVENMSGLVCPHCGGEIALFKTGGGERLAEEMGVPFLGRIPVDPRIVESGDSSVPFVLCDEGRPAARAISSVIAPLMRHAGYRDTISVPTERSVRTSGIAGGSRLSASIAKPT